MISELPPLSRPTLTFSKSKVQRHVTFSYSLERKSEPRYFPACYSATMKRQCRTAPTHGRVPTEKVSAEAFLSSEVISLFSLEMFQLKWSYHLSRIVYKEFFFNYIEN